MLPFFDCSRVTRLASQSYDERDHEIRTLFEPSIAARHDLTNSSTSMAFSDNTESQ
jgi:hypothetical protein